MQIRTDGVVWQELDDELVLMDLDRSVYLTTNATGSALAKLLSEERTREELAEYLVEHFGISSERALVDVDVFVTQLREKNLLR
jgi:Coenzyme PQQ synthesis protein D (PqqD)